MRQKKVFTYFDRKLQKSKPARRSTLFYDYNTARYRVVGPKLKQKLRNFLKYRSSKASVHYQGDSKLTEL